MGQHQVNEEPAGFIQEEEEGYAKQMYKLFKVENEAQHCSVVNMLEMFAALIILADFSVEG